MTITARTARWTAAALVALAAATSAFAVDPAVRKLAKDPDPLKRSDAARALGREGTSDAATLLADLVEDRSPFVRDAAVLACGHATAAAAVQVIAKLGTSKHELTRRNAAAALGLTRSDAALPHLTRLALNDLSPAVRADAVDALRQFQGRPEAFAVVLDALKDDDPSVRAAAVEAAGRIDREACVPHVRKALEDPDEGVRAVARGEMRFVARTEALALLASGAADASWRIRAQTVDDALWLRDARAIDALVALVGDPVQRVAAAAHRALQTLTGRDIGRDADLWKAWWEQNRAAWSAPHGTMPGANTAPPAATRASYHGLDVASDRVAFVVDVSASMRMPLAPGDGRTRWDAARDELTRVLGELKDGTLVQIVLFQDSVSRAFPQATPLADRSRREAEAFLRATPGERGDLLGGVVAALQDERIDTVFVLSDGAPSAGEMVDKIRVQGAIRQANRLRKAAIHTIGIGVQSAAERNLLESLARESGGRSVVR